MKKTKKGAMSALLKKELKDDGSILNVMMTTKKIVLCNVTPELYNSYKKEFCQQGLSLPVVRIKKLYLPMTSTFPLYDWIET